MFAVIRPIICVLVSKNSLASLHSISSVSRVNAALVGLTATSPDCSSASDIQIPEDQFFSFLVSDLHCWVIITFQKVRGHSIAL